MKIFMICALALIAGCDFHIPSRDISAEEAVERYKNVDVVKVKTIGDTGCDLSNESISSCFDSRNFTRKHS